MLHKILIDIHILESAKALVAALYMHDALSNITNRSDFDLD